MEYTFCFVQSLWQPSYILDEIMAGVVDWVLWFVCQTIINEFLGSFGDSVL